jgi:lactoylglutathione lyase
MTWTAGIRAVTLFVKDLGVSKKFYGEVFRLPVHFEDDDSVVYNFGNTVINLLKIPAAPEAIAPAAAVVREATPGHSFEITISVENVDSVVEELTSRGVKLLVEPVDRSWGLRTASFHDPDGYIWEIAHPI